MQVAIRDDVVPLSAAALTGGSVTLESAQSVTWECPGRLGHVLLVVMCICVVKEIRPSGVAVGTTLLFALLPGDARRGFGQRERSAQDRSKARRTNVPTPSVSRQPERLFYVECHIRTVRADVLDELLRPPPQAPRN